MMRTSKIINLNHAGKKVAMGCSEIHIGTEKRECHGQLENFAMQQTTIDNFLHWKLRQVVFFV